MELAGAEQGVKDHRERELKSGRTLFLILLVLKEGSNLTQAAAKLLWQQRMTLAMAMEHMLKHKM